MMRTPTNDITNYSECPHWMDFEYENKEKEELTIADETREMEPIFTEQSE